MVGAGEKISTEIYLSWTTSPVSPSSQPCAVGLNPRVSIQIWKVAFLSWVILIWHQKSATDFQSGQASCGKLQMWKGSNSVIFRRVPGSIMWKQCQLCRKLCFWIVTKCLNVACKSLKAGLYVFIPFILFLAGHSISSLQIRGTL